jgi:hypothetical protein
MDVHPTSHPTDRTLSSFGLGKLDDGLAEAVNQHLERCPECRQRVAEMSADSFLARIRDVQRSTSHPVLSQSQPGETPRDKGVNSSPASTLPPGLADHPEYEIKRELGRGGMGVVYLAHNTLMGRDEVLKVMSREIMERPGVLDRFLREIRAVAKLRHPNIVTAYHATRLGESIVFAMEHVEGLDLARLVKARGPIPVRHACNFVYQAALGLQHAHEGLVHRDIKPGNLMLARKGDKSTIKVLDFGLAKATREEKVDSALTHQGQALGTPDFIAPEQILDAQSADIRSDIYSLGGTLYYLLTGRPPFQANSLYDLYQAHVSQVASPLNLVRPEVPTELAALVAKMMAKDPARRFQTPGEVAESLMPFFKKGNSAFARPNADVCRVETAASGGPASGQISSPTPPASDAEGPIIRAMKATEPTGPEARWESLIDVNEPEHIAPLAAPVAGPESLRKSIRRFWRPVAAAVGLAAILLVAGVTYRISTDYGELVIQAEDPNIEVIVKQGGHQVTIVDKQTGNRVELSSGDYELQLSGDKPGLRLSTEKFTLKRGDKAVVTVSRQPAVGTDKQARQAGEWTLLFNGRDLAGWVVDSGDEKAWQVRNKSLAVQAPEKYSGGIGYLLSDRAYADYDLHFQFQQNSDTARSGIALRAVPHETARNSNPDLQGDWPFHLTVWIGKYPAWMNQESDRTGALFRSPDEQGSPPLDPDEPAQIKPPGEWNDMEIKMRGHSLRIAVNGRDVQNVMLNKFPQLRFPAPGLKRYSGRIGLLKHTGEVRFRNIEIMEPGPPAANPGQAANGDAVRRAKV